MARRILIICFIMIIVSPLIPLSIISDNHDLRQDLQAVNGMMNLDKWSFDDHKVLQLNGEWEFYWDQLLTPEDFKKEGNEKPSLTGYMKVPSQWNGKKLNGLSLPVYGCATYRLILKNIPFSGTYGLKKNNIRFSSRIYVNGSMLFEDGNPSKETIYYQSGNVPRIGFFNYTEGDIEILVQVANYEYINSGIPVSVYVGKQSAMMGLQQKNSLLEFSAFIILGAIALIYFIFFVTAVICRRKDSSSLAFAVLCLTFAASNVLLSERPVLLILPRVFLKSHKALFIEKAYMALMEEAAQFYTERKQHILLLQTLQGILQIRKIMY